MKRSKEPPAPAALIALADDREASLRVGIGVGIPMPPEDENAELRIATGLRKGAADLLQKDAAAQAAQAHHNRAKGNEVATRNKRAIDADYWQVWQDEADHLVADNRGRDAIGVIEGRIVREAAELPSTGRVPSRRTIERNLHRR